MATSFSMDTIGFLQAINKLERRFEELVSPETMRKVCEDYDRDGTPYPQLSTLPAEPASPAIRPVKPYENARMEHHAHKQHPLSWLAEVDHMPQAVAPAQASKGRDNERKQTHRDDSHTLLQRGGVAADAVRPAHHAL